MVSTNNLRRPSSNICSFNLGGPGVSRLMEWTLYALPPLSGRRMEKEDPAADIPIGATIW